MTTPLEEHLDTAINDLENIKKAITDKTIQENISEKDRKKFLSLFLSKAKQQIAMMELYLK